MSSYIDIPIETDPDLLAQEAFDFIQANIAGWVPNDANLETIFVEALARMTAEARDVASAVPTDIFRYFGELAGIPPQEATFAQGSTDWTMINTAGYTIPAGTQVGIVVSGDTTVGFETLADVVVLPGASVANNVVIQAVEAGAASSGVTGAVSLLDNLDFVTTITLDAPTTGGVDAEDDDVYLNRLALRLQLMAPRPIIARDFSIFAQDIAGVARAVTLDGYNPNHNLLTANQSSLETDTGGWAAQTNCTIARDTTQHSDGAACLRLRSTTSGDMEAVTSPLTTYAVTPGQRITAIADSRAVGTVRSCRLRLLWYTSGSVLISATTGASQTNTNTTWATQLSVSGNAPATAAYVQVAIDVLSTSIGNEDHLFDRISLKHYDGTGWSIGGTPEFNNERMVAVACVDSSGLAISGTLKTAVDAYLQAAREVNFVVNVIDPTYATVDVSFTAVAVTGFLPTDIKAAGEQALTDYLSPANWGLPGVAGDVPFSPQWINSTTIRYLELAQVLNNVPGLDYISALTFRIGTDPYASTDIAITSSAAGPVALPLPGTMVGTVT